MYTYAFFPRSKVLLELPEGILGSLALIDGAYLSAVVELGLEAEQLQASDEQLMQAVLAHDRVIRELFRQTVVLPLRFGTYFVSREGLLEHLEARSSEYLKKLANLQGKAEYVLKLVPLELPEESIASDLKGKDYFLAKKQRYQSQTEQQQQRQNELERVMRAIAQHYPDSIRSEPKDGVERIYLLGSFLASFTPHHSLPIWQSQCPHWQLSLGEALPPYHFV
ncbi:MAG: gas vesicle protein [Leptolyngbyaceae cyanobacterium SL_5_9]|nr:gas vesicle protein [Leptolyngbyaceae cyanobacterium SL_5_9]NJO72823.1 gas vesicle protein [Leptolyngbyaceae cyanobacterium RM1_406_9]